MQSYKHTGRHTGIHTIRNTGRQIRHRQTGRQDIQAYIHTVRQDRQTYTQANIHTYKHADSQTGRQRKIQKYR